MLDDIDPTFEPGRLGPDGSEEFERRALGLGRFLLRQGRLSEGLVWLKRAVQYEPESEQARFALGRAYLEAGLADQAINELRKAVRLEPQNDAARRLLQKALSQRAADRR